jgi:hypothetical protein
MPGLGYIQGELFNFRVGCLQPVPVDAQEQGSCRYAHPLIPIQEGVITDFILNKFVKISLMSGENFFF